jgi:hypothetical protein
MNDKDHDHEHGADYEAVFHPDGDGLPCFGCYFGAVFDALSEDQVASITLTPDDVDDEEPEAVDYARRVGATFATVADAVASLAVQIAADAAPELLEAFHERIDHMVHLILAPVAGHAH